MFLTAYGYRELNRSVPDCGTSFTWATKAFGPYTGWLCGWGAVLATVIVLSNLAGVAVTFFYLFIARVTGISRVRSCSPSRSPGTGSTRSPGSRSPRSSPGVIGSIFAFWGWDTCLTVNEESKDATKMPGRAAIVTVLTILLTYLLVAIAAMMYAGVGAEGLGLGNEETSSDVFGALAEPVMGQWPSLLLFLAVVTSSLASLQTTFLPPARTLLAMGEYQAIPTRFAHVHPRFQIPSYATLACGIATGAFYTIMTLLSEEVLSDTILTLGIMICFYYGLTAFACVWYFRRELFASTFNIVFKFLFPLIGGLMLAAVFIVSVVDSSTRPTAAAPRSAASGSCSSSPWDCCCSAWCSCWCGAGATRPSSAARPCATTLLR